MRIAGRAAGLLDLLLPPGCVACGTWIPGGAATHALVCGRCRSRLPTAPWPRCPRCHLPLGTGRPSSERCRECREWPDALTRARYATVLAPPADVLVHALKYGGWAELAPEMSGRMAAVALPGAEGRRGDLIVPVPTTRERVRKRGYNQAERLAAGLGEVLGLPVLEAMVRTRGGTTQVALHPSQRRANVRSAFAVREEVGSRLRGTHVLLVDDVLTTGATAGAAATELARVGASEITLVVYARALPFRRDAG